MPATATKARNEQSDKNTAVNADSDDLVTSALDALNPTKSKPKKKVVTSSKERALKELTATTISRKRKQSARHNLSDNEHENPADDSDDPNTDPHASGSDSEYSDDDMEVDDVEKDAHLTDPQLDAKLKKYPPLPVKKYKNNFEVFRKRNEKDVKMYHPAKYAVEPESFKIQAKKSKDPASVAKFNEKLEEYKAEVERLRKEDPARLEHFINEYHISKKEYDESFKEFKNALENYKRTYPEAFRLYKLKQARQKIHRNRSKQAGISYVKRTIQATEGLHAARDKFDFIMDRAKRAAKRVFDELFQSQVKICMENVDFSANKRSRPLALPAPPANEDSDD